MIRTLSAVILALLLVLSGCAQAPTDSAKPPDPSPAVASPIPSASLSVFTSSGWTVDLKDVKLIKGGMAEYYKQEAVLEPTPSDLIVDGRFNSEHQFIESLVRVSYQGKIYDSPKALPKNIDRELKVDIETAYVLTIDAWKRHGQMIEQARQAGRVQVSRTRSSPAPRAKQGR